MKSLRVKEISCFFNSIISFYFVCGKVGKGRSSRAGINKDIDAIDADSCLFYCTQTLQPAASVRLNRVFRPIMPCLGTPEFRQNMHAISQNKAFPEF